ncbi:serine protease 7-like [Drosophila montana]|uniref:serine protease 7-like n=1 Tax=Drosophila montana TaxID=40370 RepID=UPI00313E956B
MQLEFGLICVLLATGAVRSASLEDAKCGYISEEELLRQNNFAVPTEHQWLARIMYKNGHETKLPNDGCLGVLISLRNVLAPAHCFLLYDGRANAYSVQLGVWNKTSKPLEPDCAEDGYCVMPAQEIPLEGIAVHPEYDPVTLKHSLAVLTLKRDASRTTNVMPVCMPPSSSLHETLVGQLFVVAGLPTSSELKHKTWVHTISRPYCQEKHGALVTNTHTVCGYQDRMKMYYVGAPLVGIQVSSDEPQYFYLVGLLLDSKKVDDKELIVASFLDLRHYIGFINRNAEF